VVQDESPEESSANSFLSGVNSILERVSDIEELRMLSIPLAPANQKFASRFVFVPLTDAVIIKYVNIQEFC
jgi:hypothetical protein